MINRFKYIVILILFPVLVLGQNPNGDYNPYVNTGIISPAPLWPLESNGTGTITFNIGNTGSDPLQVYTDQYITLTITLSYGEPDNADPLAAIGGTSAGLFSWRFENGTYSATQIAEIPASSSGSITIAYKVSQNSASPGLNGFNINISPAPYQTESNSQNDDALSSYTWTEIRDYGDAPVSYGEAFHSLDFENYLGNLLDGETENQDSENADGDDLNGQDDEDGVVFPSVIQQGETIDISVAVAGMGRINAWVDWNGDGDFDDADERIITNIPGFDGTYDFSINVPLNSIISNPTFARFRFSPGNLSSGSGSAVGGEVEDYSISISASMLAPTIPQGLKIDSFTDNSVSISWNASTDNNGVTGYRIYRDDELLTTVTELNYTDNTVSPGNSYKYAVSAINAAGYESDLSDSVTASISDNMAPTVPAGLKITSVSTTSITFSWNASSDNVAVTGYNIFRDDVFLESTSGLNYTDTDVSEGNSYSYSVSAFDASGNESEKSAGVNASINDVTPPSIPSGLEVSSFNTRQVSLLWNASTDNVGVFGYRVYRDGAFLASESGTSYTDNSVSLGNSYSYTVSAYDEMGNESDQSEAVDVSITDNEAPAKPTGLTATFSKDFTIELSWNATYDNIGVAGYQVYRGGVDIHITADTSFIDAGVVMDNEYSYFIVAYDESGNFSLSSDVVTVNTYDDIPPSVPDGLKAMAASENGISFTWNPSVDNFGVAGYRVFRDGSLLSAVNSNSYMDKNIDPGSSYSYAVSSFDVSGNESELSESITIGLTSTDYIIVSKLSLYPNPSRGEFVIEINQDSGDFILEIISTDGVLVVKKNLNMSESNMPVNLDFLERGFYYIRVSNNERIYDGKLVILK